MNQINHAINGLASSLLLNVGLTRIAEKFDTVAQRNAEAVVTVEGAAPCEICDYPCMFTAESGE